MGLPNGVHHLAINTGDIKAQIAFFTEVLGAELKALYWMHGREGVIHAFLQLNPLSSIAFVQTPEGVAPAAEPGRPVAASMNHVALSVETEEDLLRLRDRIRSHGLVAFGPVDHTFCKSIYLGGPEGLGLEIATNPPSGIDQRAWIDPDVAGTLGIDRAELARYVAPPADQATPSAVPQPPLDRSKPHPHWPAAMLDRFLALDDDQVLHSMGNIAPPVAVE